MKNGYRRIHRIFEQQRYEIHVGFNRKDRLFLLYLPFDSIDHQHRRASEPSGDTITITARNRQQTEGTQLFPANYYQPQIAVLSDTPSSSPSSTYSFLHTNQVLSMHAYVLVCVHVRLRTLITALGNLETCSCCQRPREGILFRLSAFCVHSLDFPERKSSIRVSRCLIVRLSVCLFFYVCLIAYWLLGWWRSFELVPLSVLS